MLLQRLDIHERTENISNLKKFRQLMVKKPTLLMGTKIPNSNVFRRNYMDSKTIKMMYHMTPLLFGRFPKTTHYPQNHPCGAIYRVDNHLTEFFEAHRPKTISVETKFRRWLI